MEVSAQLDRLMEQASTALVRMDYLECEALCLRALGEASRAGLWPYYARILLPLQEARRQRRMIAAEGTVRLGTTNLSGGSKEWLGEIETGCILLTQPHDRSVAENLQRLARTQRRFIEVLFADNAADAPIWKIRSFAGPDVSVTQPAPRREWLNSWLSANDATTVPDSSSQPRLNSPVSPADWFLDACEALGDAALAQVDTSLKGVRRVAALERCLLAVTDHEILHQRLADAARTAGN